MYPRKNAPLRDPRLESHRDPRLESHQDRNQQQHPRGIIPREQGYDYHFQPSYEMPLFRHPMPPPPRQHSIARDRNNSFHPPPFSSPSPCPPHPPPNQYLIACDRNNSYHHSNVSSSPPSPPPPPPPPPPQHLIARDRNNSFNQSAVSSPPPPPPPQSPPPPPPPPPRHLIARERNNSFHPSTVSSSSSPPPPPPPPPQHLIARDRNNSPPPPPPPPPLPDDPSRIGEYDNNHSRGWNVPDSTHQQCYNQNVFLPVLPPALSMYPTDTNNPVLPVPPVQTSAIPHSRPQQQVPFVTPNPTCPPLPFPNEACPTLPLPRETSPPPPPPPKSNMYDNNFTNSSLQSNMPVPQPAAPSFISDTSLNVYPSPLIPSRDTPMTFSLPNFNIPPPNLPMLNNCMTVQQKSCGSYSMDFEKDMEEAIYAQRQNDQSWIDQRFSRSKCCLPQSTIRKESITINEAQKLIRDMLILAAQLQQQTKNLELIMATASKDDWMKEVEKIELMKEQLEHYRQKVLNEDTMVQLEMKVKKRQKTRERLKRSRARCHEEKQEELVRRNERHCRLDDWRDAISQKEDQMKKDKEMKSCVDSVLSEVRKKKSDVSKMLELIKTLSKLRKIRKENVAKKGLYTYFHHDRKFEEDYSRLQRILNCRMEIYESEQQTLMVMLQSEQEQTKEKERVHSHKVQAEIDKREHKREQHLLFGKRTIEEDDPVYPFMKVHSQAEDNWEAFIQIRSDWDSYLVPENTPGGSRLPNTWVMPSEPSDALWAKFLES